MFQFRLYYGRLGGFGIFVEFVGSFGISPHFGHFIYINSGILSDLKKEIASFSITHIGSDWLLRVIQPVKWSFRVTQRNTHSPSDS